MWNTKVSFCTGKKIICAFMFIISNHHGIKCLSNLLHLEPWNVMYWCDYWHIATFVWFVKYNRNCNQFLHRKKNDLCIDVYHKQSLWNKMAHWYDWWNTIVIAINFRNGKKMIRALMFIIRNNYGKKFHSDMFELEPCNVML